LKLTKTVVKYFLQLKNVFLNYKPKKLTSTSQQWHSISKSLPHVNTTSTTIINYFTNPIVNFPWLMDEFHLLTMYDINKVLSSNFDYISTMWIECLTNDAVTHGTRKTFHHQLTMVEIKSKGKLCCNYDGQCIGQWWDDMCGDLIGFGMNQ
jgi:hypothetical protein